MMMSCHNSHTEHHKRHELSPSEDLAAVGEEGESWAAGRADRILKLTLPTEAVFLLVQGSDLLQKPCQAPCVATVLAPDS